MKYLLYIICFLFFACQKENKSIEISGQLQQLPENKKLNVTLAGQANSIAEWNVGDNLYFSFKGVLPSKKLLTIQWDDYTIPLYVEANDYKLLYQDGEYTFKALANSSLHNCFIDYIQEEKDLSCKYNASCQNYDTISDIQRKAEYSAFLSKKFNALEEFRLNAIRQFAGTELAQWIIYNSLYFYSFDYKSFSNAIQALGDSIPDCEMKKVIFKAYETLKDKQLTGMAPDFLLVDKNDRKVSLTDFKGKYLLIDFWASWCAPCRAKNRVLNKQYHQLQKMGLEVVSISLDDDKKLWLKAIEEDCIQWTQLIDLNGFKKSKIRKDYKVEQVPTVYLIDPKGKIIATNPSEDDLKKLIK